MKLTKPALARMEAGFAAYPGVRCSLHFMPTNMKQTYETHKRLHWRGFASCFITYHLWNTGGGMSSSHLAKSASAARSPSTARPITAHCFAQYKRQSFTRAWSRAFANQSSDTINETRRRFDSRRRASRRNFGAGAFFVIGNALEVVGLRQKNP